MSKGVCDVAMMDCSMTNVLGEEDEDEELFEIIEEISDNEGEEKKEDTPEACETSESSLSSSNEFSLSSLKSALGEALSGSATSFGTAAEKIGTFAESLKSASLHNAPSPKVTNDSSSSHSSSGNHHKQQQYAKAKSLVDPSFEGRRRLIVEGGKPRGPPVNFGKFEERARPLRYTNEDMAEIADDPKQFAELRLALREMGAVTDTTLKLKLHWYIRNTKRERKRAQQEAEQKRILQQQQEHRKQQQYLDTPPTEAHVVDRAKVLSSCSSPNSVRGIYVPQSL